MKNTYSLDLEASSSQYAYVADNAALSITGDISIEAWIKLEQLPSTQGTDMVIAGKYYTTTNKRSYLFYFTSTNTLKFSYSADGGTTISTFTTSSAAVTPTDVGKWIHVAISVDVSAETGVIYKMGSSLAVTTVASGVTSIYDGNQRFAIGSSNTEGTPASFFDGLLNNVRVWSDIRTETEITDNMYSILTGTTNNLVGSWYATANNHNDLAGTNNLTAVNTPVFSTDVPFSSSSFFLMF